MKNLTFLKLFVTTMFVMATALFAGCVDDNDDTEVPRLEVSPKTLVFDTDGTPVEGSQSYFEISANRHWTATVLDDKTWVTLSKMEGDGSDKVQVSIPEGITDEAKVLIQISNKVGVLMKEEVTIRSGNIVPEVAIYKETFGTAEQIDTKWPLVADFTGWVKSGEGSDNVSYENSGNVSVRQSGKLSAGYEGASGNAKVFFGTNSPTFIIKEITLKPDQTNLKLGFGASYSKSINGGNYDNTFKPESFHFYLSKDGITWSSAIQYDYKQANEFWVYVTSNFTLKQAVNTLYIKFAADIESGFAIDDVKLSTGNGGQEIDLGGGSEPEEPATKITIPELNAMMPNSNEEKALEASYYFEAVVQNDVEGGNYSYNNLVLATENATEAGNGITLYDSNLTEPSKHDLNKGDKVKVTLLKDLAKVQNYNGLYELKGTGNWVTIEKLNETATINPVTITADKLADYQGMYVTIENVTSPEAGVWAVTNKISTHTFNVEGNAFTVFCRKAAAAFVNKTFKSAERLSISGLAAVNSNKGQLVPRNLDDVKSFNAEIPWILSVDPTSLSFPAEGGEKTVDVEVLNKGNNELSTSGIEGATVNGNKVTVNVGENKGTTPIEKTLTISINGGNSIDIKVTIAAPASGDTFEVTLTSAEIAQMTSTGYATFNYDNSFGNWSGKCGITATDTKGEAPYLQINFDSNVSKGAFNSHIKVPELNGIVQKIVITTSIKTVAKRYLLICEPDYVYKEKSTQSDLDNAAKATSNKSVDKGETFTFENLENLNLSQFSIFPGGGAVYISSITITCKKK